MESPIWFRRSCFPFQHSQNYSHTRVPAPLLLSKARGKSESQDRDSGPFFNSATSQQKNLTTPLLRAKGQVINYTDFRAQKRTRLRKHRYNQILITLPIPLSIYSLMVGARVSHRNSSLNWIVILVNFSDKKLIRSMSCNFLSLRNEATYKDDQNLEQECRSCSLYPR